MADTNSTLFPEERDIPEKYRINPISQREYLVNGQLKTWNGEMQKVLSPVCIREGDRVYQKAIGEYPLMNKETALECLDAAVQAYGRGRGVWPTMSVEKRINHVETFLTNMAKSRDEVINLLMWEIGKSYNDSAKEFDRTIDYVGATISELKNLDRISSRPVVEEGVFGQIRRTPLGTGLCMGPFNYPLNETFTTLIPAVIMGNPIVFKPAKYGVLLHKPLLKAYQESFPPGVINIIYGNGKEITGPIMASGKIDVLAFIGSAGVASILEKQHPEPNKLECIEGLNAKNPAIIFNDANLETALAENVAGALSYNGQRCTAHKIIFVQREIADQFISQFCERVDNLKWGMPWTPGVAITPLPEAGKPEFLESLVQDARIKGARVANVKGGQTINTFYSPTVLTGVKSDMEIYQKEQFGPVVPIIVFDEIDEPLDYIDNSEYGQQVALFGRDPRIIGPAVDVLVNLVSRVNLNSQCQRGPDTFPFGGRKNSAKKVLSISDALKVLSTRSLAGAKYTPENQQLLRNIREARSSTFLSTDWIF